MLSNNLDIKKKITERFITVMIIAMMNNLLLYNLQFIGFELKPLQYNQLLKN